MPRLARPELPKWLPLRRSKGGKRRNGSPEPTRARVVCVASGKGGTGKSVLCSNLAVIRAQRGERVLLVDFDAGLANDHLLLGLSPRHDLVSVLNGQVAVSDALVEGPDGLHLLSGGVGRHGLANPTKRELDRLFRALEPLEERFDLILIDHAAGLGYSTVAHLAAAETLLIVTGHEVTALSDAYALFKRALMANPFIRSGLVINRVPTEVEMTGAWDRFRGAAQRFLGKAPELVGWIKADEAISRSVERRQPVSVGEPRSGAALALREIARWHVLDRTLEDSSFYGRARRVLS